jgi:hypothetical protein
MRSVALPLAVLALAATPAATAVPANPADGFCDGREPSAADRREEAITTLQQQRRERGMPASRAHIEALLDSPAARQRGSRLDVGLQSPMTAAEYRYFRKVERLESRFERVARYLETHERAIHGSWAFADDWPRGPYLAVYVTRDAKRIRSAIDKRAGYPFRVVRVEKSFRELERQEERIDARTLERLGIGVEETWIEPRRNRVEVTVSASRPDAAALVRARYGSDLAVTVVPPPPPFTERCVRVHTYRLSPDGLRLTVPYDTDSWNSLARVFVAETAEAVTVGPIVRIPEDPPAFGTGALRETEVTLSAPLGSRQVRDAESGTVLRRSTDSSK